MASMPVGQYAAGAETIQPGTRVQVGRYCVTVQRYLSRGGFAQVYLVMPDSPVAAVPTPPGARVPPLVLKHMVVWNRDALSSVRGEVEHHRRLQGSPCIVQFVEASATALQGNGWEIFILMEYCAGGGLIDYLNTRLQNRLHEREVLAVFRDVCAAVQVMHHMDPPLVHRDLKIENVLLSGTQPPTFKLCDFGSCFPLLSRKPPQSADELRRLEQELNTHTTLQYRSPEMVDLTQRRVIDTSADVWALGVLLYKLCYYTTPFEGPNGGPRAILQGRFNFPSHPRYSSTLQALIAGMLRVEQRERPSVDAVLERVHGMLGLPPPAPVHAADTTSVRRTETVRRNGTVRRDELVQQRPASASPRPTHAVSPPPAQPAASGAALGRSATTAHAPSGPSVLSRAATFQARGAPVGRSAPPKPASLAARGPSSARVSPEPRASPRASPHPPAAAGRTPSPSKDTAPGVERTADAGKEPFSPALVDAQSRFPSVDQLDAAPTRDRVRSVAEQLNRADRPASDAPAPHTAVLVDIDSGDEDEGPEDVGPMIRLHPRGAPKDTVLDMSSADERAPEPEPEPEPEPRRAPGGIRSQIAAIQEAVGAAPASTQRQRAPARRLSDLVAQDTAQKDTNEPQSSEEEIRAIEQQEKALAALLQSDTDQGAGEEDTAQPEPVPVESPAAEPAEGKLIDIESPKVMTPKTEAQKRAPSWDENEAAPPRRPSAGKPPVGNKPTAHKPPVLNKPPVANKPAVASKPAAQKPSGNNRPAPAPASVPQRASTWDVANKSKPPPPQKKYVDVSTSPGLHPVKTPDDAGTKETDERAAAPPESPPAAPAQSVPAARSERSAEPAASAMEPERTPEEKRPSIHERMEQLKLAQQPTSEPPAEHRTGKPSPRWPPAGSPPGSPPRSIESQLNSALHQPNTRLTKRTTVAGAPRAKPQAVRPWEQEAQQTEAYQKQRVIPAQEDRTSPQPEEGTSFRGVSAMVNRWQSGGAQ